MRLLQTSHGDSVVAAGARVDREEKRFGTLLRLWQWHRLQFLLMAEGATASMGDNHHSVPDSRPPKSVAHEIRELEERWDACESNNDRRRVIKASQEMLRAFKFAKADPRTIRGTRDWRRAIALDERPANVVARFYGVSKRSVYNYRDEFRDERAKPST